MRREFAISAFLFLFMDRWNWVLVVLLGVSDILGTFWLALSV